MLIGDHPKNETKEHYELKQIAKYILFGRGYKHIATEVCNCHGRDRLEVDGCYFKEIIDAIGVKTISWYSGKVSSLKVMGVEAKASLSDFRNGFCTDCELTYIIAPKGIIPIEELPKGIGLIEVDLNSYSIEVLYGKISFNGITIVKKASARLANRFDDKGAYQNWCLSIFRSIAYRSTVENLFKCSQIQLIGKKKGEQ